MAPSKESLARLIREEGVAPRIVQAFTKVDRADFVPSDAVGDAYADHPIALPERQTTSQPSLIARMIDAAEVADDDRVLEVGTGYGFQTALLSELGASVVSIERSATLAQRARANLAAAGIDGVEVVVGDGWRGVPGRAPFDAIVVSAAATEVPEALVEQLAERGRLVIPVKRGANDAVYRYEKRKGRLTNRRLITPAVFVPLVPGRPS